MGNRTVKRALDLLLATFSLVLLAPVFVIVALMVRRKLGSPVLFRQQRPGHHGRLFAIIKFRTMVDGRNEGGELLPDSQRLTSLGRFLRSTSLDELPELINVLKGEMSLVGPRPLFAEYLPYYTRQEALRHLVRPGITGWAQINGRNYLPWNQRLSMDIWYVENQSLMLDLKILVRTVWQVLHRKGVAADSDVAELYLSEEVSRTLTRRIDIKDIHDHPN